MGGLLVAADFMVVFSYFICPSIELSLMFVYLFL